MAYSREVRAIIDYVGSAGLPYRVTDVNGPGHAPRSYHYQEGTDGRGLAVDLAGTAPGITPVTTVQMAAIWHVLFDRADQLAELIHNSAGITQAVHNGRVVDGASFYGPTVWANHRNHVHVAVNRGTILEKLSQSLRTLGREAPAMAENVYEAQARVVAAFPSPSGKGYTLVTADGAVFAFGDAEYHGRVTTPAE